MMTKQADLQQYESSKHDIDNETGDFNPSKIYDKMINRTNTLFFNNKILIYKFIQSGTRTERFSYL